MGSLNRLPSELHHVFGTCLGPCGIAWSERGVTRLQLPERTPAATEHRLRARSAFHRAIYEAMRSLGWGQTATYGDLARQAGSPGAARAVGQAMGQNPVPIIIPCHRVLAAGRKIGGFSAYGGLAPPPLRARCGFARGRSLLTCAARRR